MKTLVSMVLFLAPALPVHAATVSQRDAAALNALGAQLYAAGDYPNAEKRLEEALAIQQTAATPDPGTGAGILFNLAAVARIESRLPESEALYHRAIAIREAVSGPESSDLGRPLAGLALAYLAEGRLAQAMEAAERAFRVSGNQPVVENTLATVLMARGDSARAEALERKVTDNLNRDSASTSREYLDALTNLGTVHLRLGNYRQAELELRQAEGVALQVAGPNHPMTATVWNNLAKTRAAQGASKDAERLFQKAIAAWCTTLGPAHPDVAYGLSNLAALYQSRKRYSAADRLYRQAIEIDEASLGTGSLKVANDWNNLGALAAVQHHYRDAESAISKGLAIADKKAGFEHPDTARIAVNLALVYYSQGKYLEASSLFAKALPVKERVLGPDSAEFAGLLRLYARSLRAAHDYAGAERAELRATRIVTRSALVADARQ